MSTAAAVPTANSTPPPVPQVHITRFLRAPRERVFAAWTEPEQMKGWMGPINFTCLEAETDLRVGGRYRFVVRGTLPPSNGEVPQERTNTVTGEYLELRPPELVRYTWRGDLSPGWESIVTIRLHQEAGGTRLELLHEGFSSADLANNYTGGWNSVLDKLAAYIAR
jgi:uncharacterized protein YndB with AHSA1/START domain